MNCKNEEKTYCTNNWNKRNNEVLDNKKKDVKLKKAVGRVLIALSFKKDPSKKDKKCKNTKKDDAKDKDNIDSSEEEQKEEIIKESFKRKREPLIRLDSVGPKRLSCGELVVDSKGCSYDVSTNDLSNFPAKKFFSVQNTFGLSFKAFECVESSLKKSCNENEENKDGKSVSSKYQNFKNGGNFERRKAVCDLKGAEDGEHSFKKHGDFKRERKQSSADLGIHYPGDLLTQARPRRMATVEDFASGKSKQVSMLNLLLAGEQEKKSKTPFCLIKREKKTQGRLKGQMGDLAHMLHNLKKSEFNEEDLLKYKVQM